MQLEGNRQLQHRCELTCGGNEAESPHVILQVTPEQHHLLGVEAQAARVGCKDCRGQKVAEL